MNILYDHSIFRLQRYGGISKYFYELIKRFINENNIHLFKGININEYNLEQYKDKFASYTNYKISEVKYAGFFTNKINNIWFDKIYSKMSNGIYHPTYYRMNLKKFDKIPVVLTVYDMTYELYPQYFWNSKFVIQSKKNSIEHADAIICISENTKKDLLRFYDVPEDKISVVYMGCSSDTKIYQNINVSKKPYLLYVGDRSVPYKNFWKFFESYTKYLSDKYNLVLFGNDFSKQERMFMVNNNIQNKVIRLQGNDTLLSNVYHKAYCLVYPSLYEGFGIPLIEAMSNGCPVTVSNASSLPEVAGKACMMFDPLYESEMVESILSVQDHRSWLIENGYKQAKKFSWDKTAFQTMKVYASVTK